MSRKAELKAKLSMDDSQFSVGIKRALNKTEAFANQAVKKLAIVGAAGGAAIAAGLYQAVQAASNLSETVSKAQAIFGKSAAGMEAWAAAAASAFGQSKQQALDGASTFAIFGKSAGLAGDALTTFSQGLVQLAADFASFYNTSPEQAITAIGAALRGESEPIRQFGVLLDAATLKAEALKLGLIETTKDALTPQQRVLASHAAILSQSNVAQGDFARTSDGLANSTKIMQAELANASAEIGEGLLPAMTQIATATNSFIQELNRTGTIDAFAQSIAALPAAISLVTSNLLQGAAAMREFLDATTTFNPIGRAIHNAILPESETLENKASGARKFAAKLVARSGKGVATAHQGPFDGPSAAAEAAAKEIVKGGAGGVSAGGGGVGGSGGGSGADIMTGIPGGAGVFAHGFGLSLGDTGRSSQMGMDTTESVSMTPGGPVFSTDSGFNMGVGINPASALDMIEGHRDLATPGVVKVDPFKNFTTASRGSALGGGSTVSALGGGSEGSALDGGAYNVIRRGDAARKKAEAVEKQGGEGGIEGKLDKLIQVTDSPQWTTQ